MVPYNIIISYNMALASLPLCIRTCNHIIVILIYANGTLVRRCGAGGNMRACHVTGPGSIPDRDKFPV